MLIGFFRLLNTIRQGDYYLITEDFDSYIAALKMVDEAYQNRTEWVKKSIRTTAKVATIFLPLVLN